MPDFNKPAGQWLGNQLSAVKSTARAVASQGTEYIVDNEGVCRAIIGHLVAEPSGTATGLEGWGVAVKNSGGAWGKLTGAGPFVTGAEAVNVNARANGVVVRLEEAGASARLEGNIQAVTAAIPAGTALFTIPAAYRPRESPIRAGAVDASSNTAGVLQISSGVVTYGEELAKGAFLEWGSLTYSV